ncbi:hypothetical protein JJD66_12480 [Pseudomonas sp. MF6751]|uniref:hypothetical protein n=1 Tax=Pseudomonas sp. MF6751 TaxID=2797528 RepID=UPI00190B7435|nr:hypothetical protein [Pseudomonas sp. MF6751]MBK3476903.1 hypothetical protein [Pseudomonas sp. MF6751]
MTDQTQRLEIATVRAEIGSNITFRFNNDAIDAGGIPTESGDIKNLKLIIREIEDKASVSSSIYPSTAVGLANTPEGGIFLVQSSDADEIYAVWKKVSGAAVDTGKRSLSAAAVIEATETATEAAASAQQSADDARIEVARFLSSSNSLPTQRDDGQPLQIGDRVILLPIGTEYIYRASGWEPNDISAAQQSEIDSKLSKADAANATDETKGVALFGYSGRVLKDRLDDEINIQDVWAKQGGGTSWSDAMNIAIDKASYNLNSGQRSGMRIHLPGGHDYDFADIQLRSGIVVRGDGPKNTRVYCTKPNGTIFTQSIPDRASGEFKSIGIEGILFDGGIGTSGASRIASTAVNIGGMHHSWMRDCQSQRFNGKTFVDDDAFVVDFLFDNVLSRENEFGFHFYNPYSTCITFNRVYAVNNTINWRVENIGEVEWWGCKNEKSSVEGIGIYGASCIARIAGGYSEDCALSGNRSQINIEGAASVGMRDHYMKYNADTGSDLAHVVVNGSLRTMINSMTFNSDPGAIGYDISGSASATRNIFLGENHHIGVMSRISPLAEARSYGANAQTVRGAAPSVIFQDNNGSRLSAVVATAVNQVDIQNGSGASLGTFKSSGLEIGGAWNAPHLNVNGFHIWAGTSKLRIKFGAPTSIDDGSAFVLQ